jgi:hypothetical protein
MPYAKGARYNGDKCCLPGTRTTIVDEMIVWVNGTHPVTDSNNRRILLLSRVAGSGKSSIAHTIARHFDRIGRLGASYCFSRNDQANLKPDNFFSTISRGLAHFDPNWKDALLKMVEDDRALIRFQSSSNNLL